MQTNRKKCLIIICAIVFAVTAVTAFFVFREEERLLKYVDVAEQWCRVYCVDVYWVLATIEVESGGKEDAVSHVGAQGLMQLMPETAKWLIEKLDIEVKTDIFEPELNIRLGTAYLAYLGDRFEGDNVFCAYNAGEGVVREWINQGGEIKYNETKQYVKRIKSVIRRLKDLAYLY